MDQLLDILRRVREQLWSLAIDLWDDMRRARSTPLDPTAPPSIPDESDQTVTATNDVMAVVERIEVTGARDVILRVPREVRALRDPVAWIPIATIDFQQILALEGSPMNILSPQFIPWRWLRPKADRISVTLAGQATPLAGNADVKASADGATTAATAGANETSTPTATASP